MLAGNEIRSFHLKYIYDTDQELF